ncbi:hypothetical protein ACFO3H_15720 [Halorussus sp. GCM10023401]|uniref:hypothetical protein n=2 Tax=Halorussus TaxID=1070314 RepID=UPI00209CC6F9|nr:hypothetical protein [Halorussus vallis]USZ74686.1 hypothetical protein NGM07_14730 [Halorussus vallis]
MPANSTAVQAGTTIETGTLLLAAATFFGAMVGALTQIGLGWWNRRRSRKNLRLALRSEIQSQMALDMDDPGDLTAYDDLSEVFPSPVYESNTQEIGQLSNEEAQKISQFYTALMAHRGMTGQQSSGEENEEATEEMTESVEGLRTRAIDAINDNL